MTSNRTTRLLRGACVAALVGLALTSWSVIDPRPVALLVGGAAGNAIGTLSFLLFILVVLADLRRARVLGDEEPREKR